VEEKGVINQRERERGNLLCADMLFRNYLYSVFEIYVSDAVTLHEEIKGTIFCDFSKDAQQTFFLLSGGADSEAWQ